MKTLNLNKLTILISLFLISVVFSTGANATCKKDADGKLITVSGDSDTQVIDVVTGTGERAYDQCSCKGIKSLRKCRVVIQSRKSV